MQAAPVTVSKFARLKSLREPQKKNSSSQLDQAAALDRQMQMAPQRDNTTIFAVKIISKHKVLEA